MKFLGIHSFTDITIVFFTEVNEHVQKPQGK